MIMVPTSHLLAGLDAIAVSSPSLSLATFLWVAMTDNDAALRTGQTQEQEETPRSGSLH